MTRRDLERQIEELEQTPATDGEDRGIEIRLPDGVDDETRAEIAAVARGDRDRGELSADAAAAIRAATLPDAARQDGDSA